MNGLGQCLRLALRRTAPARLFRRLANRAGIVVNPSTGKTASAHDLRRSFGSRWARKVAPAVLRELMRHSSVETTMGYYVDLNADDIADQLWAAAENAAETTETPGVVTSVCTNENGPQSVEAASSVNRLK